MLNNHTEPTQATNKSYLELYHLTQVKQAFGEIIFKKHAEAFAKYLDSLIAKKNRLCDIPLDKLDKSTHDYITRLEEQIEILQNFSETVADSLALLEQQVMDAQVAYYEKCDEMKQKEQELEMFQRYFKRKENIGEYDIYADEQHGWFFRMLDKVQKAMEKSMGKEVADV